MPRKWIPGEPVPHPLEKTLTITDESGSRGLRLVDDAQRLCHRIRRFAAMKLTAAPLNLDALELACWALQLPLRQARTSRAASLNLRDRCEQAAELLVSSLPDHDPRLLEQSIRVLRDIPRKSPQTEEARILADALNLDDFGMTGLVLQAMQLSRTNAGVTQLAEGFDKREAYGYWDARLKDGFHFEPVRQMALRRIERAQRAAQMLKDEIGEDQAPS